MSSGSGCKFSYLAGVSVAKRRAFVNLDVWEALEQCEIPHVGSHMLSLGGYEKLDLGVQETTCLLRRSGELDGKNLYRPHFTTTPGTDTDDLPFEPLRCRTARLRWSERGNGLGIKRPLDTVHGDSL